MKKNSKGEYLSVAEVSEALTATRVAESESHMINSHVNPNAGSGGVAGAGGAGQSFARQNRGQATPATLRQRRDHGKVTKERAYAAMLEEHPEAYAAFRAQHNAKGLIAHARSGGHPPGAVAPRGKEKTNMAYEQMLRPVGAAGERGPDLRRHRQSAVSVRRHRRRPASRIAGAGVSMRSASSRTSRTGRASKPRSRWSAVSKLVAGAAVNEGDLLMAERQRPGHHRHHRQLRHRLRVGGGQWRGRASSRC